MPNDDAAKLEIAIREQYQQPTGTNCHRQRRFGLSAFKSGWHAAREGKTLYDYPYQDKRTRHGSVTFSRAYIRMWQKGFEAYKKANL